ncbi:MAG TPA: S16 family serine protease, partial [Rhizomicrobium sp.]|nr:S16 family serine protease [Rhizomicrobium sp.]
GALPGQLIQMMKKAGTKNPIIMLDEVDKMSMDFRGDPSAALLEVLDPEQNFAFMDHYLDVEYDLSQVFFIATANVLHTIPPALQDRMEVIRLSGYTELEKLEIAKRFLVAKQRKDTGVGEDQVQFLEEGLLELIQSYTREAGVRNLEREIGNLCRKVARKVVEAQTTDDVPVEGSAEPVFVDDEPSVTVEEAPRKGRKKAKKEEPVPLVAIDQVVINRGTVNDMLGPARFRDLTLEKQNEIGATTGLAWTEVGGSILTTEATVMEGRGKLTTTGKLGDVMQESAQAAMSYVRSRSQYLGLPKDFYRHLDIHVHVPEGAIPKDGPSAGITIATSICSALTAIPVRCDIAMTGEITVRGRVLPIGGLKEKLLAAHRQGIHEVVVPKENEKDLAEVPENIRKDMKLHAVSFMDEVLKIALEREIVALPLAPTATAADLVGRPAEDNLTH